ncbi:MAG: 2,4-dienoyl-CoA reductase-like NADH-dependent reductase (Old Yellow Enzyme family) [Myxococcota bacterium]|jgi:2,4-dienoyl-CoA reductase-like NADH-dependent reductase (Old Yellow Enzyme family)
MSALTPGQIGTLTLRNRIIKTATFEGMTPGGQVTDALVEHHAGHARRGVALTTVAYGAVSATGRTFADQLLIPQALGLARIPPAVHAAGGAVSLQLAHCGGFSKNAAGGTPVGPSAGLNPYGIAYGLPRIRAATPTDLDTLAAEFAQAAWQARELGFDTIELHCGHGYLLSQFLSPIFNRRRDAWGGSLENRLRFPLQVLAAIRERVGADYPIIAKTNLDDGVSGGATLADGIAIAAALAEAGVDAIVPSGGLVQRSAFYLLRGQTPLTAMIASEASILQRISMRIFGPLLVKTVPYRSSFFAEDAAAVLDAVTVPVVLIGGIDSAAAIRQAMARGFGFVAMGRALLADPDFIARMEDGEDVISRCNHCNECVALMDEGVHCVL